MTKVFNHVGRAFNVRAVFRGDRYGLGNALTHDGPPMVEFYDAFYADAKGFGPIGQFVSRYYLATLKLRPVSLLSLQGDVPAWTVTAGNVLDAIAMTEAEEKLRGGKTTYSERFGGPNVP